MEHRICVFLIVCLGSLDATISPAAEPLWIGSEATRTRITVIDVDGSKSKVIFDSPHRYAAPEWTPDGASLIINGGGKLWRLPASGGTPMPVPTRTAPWIDVNHAVSPDGKSLAFTAGSIWKVPAAGGEPISITPAAGGYVHGWSPDGKWLVFSANRGHGLDLFRISADGGSDYRLTSSPQAEDAASYSPDGRWIYFLSDRGGNRDIRRMPASGAGPGDAKAEQITSDDREDAAPRCSPDGKWLVFLSYPPRTNFNAMDRDVLIRRLPLTGGRPARAKPTETARIVGGHGTLGSRPFSPDGRRVVYASFEPPPPTIRLILFTASDRTAPKDAPHRLTQIADAAERFFFSEMKRWKYPAAVSRLFRRSPDGTVEVTYVKGDHPASDRVYEKPECGQEAREKAKKQLRLEGDGHILWTFVYLGDRPQRFANWAGTGCARDGGSAVVNYDTIPVEIRSDAGLEVGFNSQYFLKGTIHELGHALGLSHLGPDPLLEMGNSLMGPNADKYIERKQPHADKVYLDEASAAILWKHPVFSGTAKDRQRQPNVKLINYKAAYSRASNRITLTGKLVSDMHAHSVFVIDDLGKPGDEYWFRSHVGRIAADGTFRVVIDQPARADGIFRMLFCFDNGIVTGDGAGVVFNDRGEIHKTYHFRNGSYRFGD
jgi:WD40-like Beta Propeller Repeat